jgi:recombination protein RecR
MLPKQLQEFIATFEKLPVLGPRQATRLAFKLIREGAPLVKNLIARLEGLLEVKVCMQCFFIHTNNGSLCSICADPSRVQDVIMVVEKETDVMSIEKTRKFQGIYLVIGELTRSGALEAWQKSRVQLLKQSIQNLPTDKAREIILALNPTTYGDLNAQLLKKELEEYAGSITRLGRGIPTGGEIEFADIDTLSSSLERRV